MTDEQKKMAKELAGCVFLPGSPPKRFVSQMVANATSKEPQPLTERQATYLAQLRHNYRKQIGNPK